MKEERAEAEAAVAIVCAREPRESVLLIRRSEREDDPWSGHWSFPGGRRDRADPDLLSTALRELEEECGLRLGREQSEADLPVALARRRTGRFLLVAPFLFGVSAELPTVLDPREAVEAVWVPRSLLLDPAQHSLLPIPGRPPEMLYPAIAMNCVPLWGFTYRLITDWLGLVPQSSPLKKAGFEAACLVLEFLLAQGLRLRRGWEDCARLPAISDQRVVRAATVEGAIPLARVLARFSAPGAHVPLVNFLEVHADYIRLAGLEFEEYLISAVT
jgi:8-oxo-dGTP pyrophosphatase MutT (NUDIX family)